jgi:hypothetical protein
MIRLGSALILFARSPAFLMPSMALAKEGAEHPDIVAKLTKQLEISIANGRSTSGARQANDVEIVIFKTKASKP